MKNVDNLAQGKLQLCETQVHRCMMIVVISVNGCSCSDAKQVFEEMTDGSIAKDSIEFVQIKSNVVYATCRIVDNATSSRECKSN